MKPINEHLLKAKDKLLIEKVDKLTEKCNGMLAPGSKTEPIVVYDETLKFLVLWPLMKIALKRFEKDYGMAYDASEKAVTLMQKKAREHKAEVMKLKHGNRENFWNG